MRSTPPRSLVSAARARAPRVLSAAGGPVRRVAGVCPTRDDVVATARAYVNHTWLPTRANVFHGRDADGVQVDTPDVTFLPNGFVPGAVQRGVPYCWGGFSSLEDFDRDVAAGAVAGHVFVDDPALHPYASAATVGVDCSGLVSRCWGLVEKEGTRTLPEIAHALPSTDQLLPGDILNCAGAHVVVFVAFADADQRTIRIVEAAGAVCTESTVTVKELLDDGYVPLRDARR